MDMSFLLQGMKAFSSQGKEMPLNFRIRKEQANSFRFWSLVRQLKDKGGSVCDNKNEPKQTEEERHQKTCKIINSANEVLTEANEIKLKITPLPPLPQQIEKQKRGDLKRNKARQVRQSEAQRIRQAPERSRMSMELEKLAYLGDPMQAINCCRKCGAIPHTSGESCLWRPSADLMEADSDDEKDSKLP
jgi:hypothetical protein